MAGAPDRRTFLRQDQRRAGLVDHDAIGLVNNRKMEAAKQHPALLSRAQQRTHLQLRARRPAACGYPVFQVVEDQLLVGAVGDVAGIGGASVVQAEAADDYTHAEPEKAEQRAHLFRVAFGQVIVDRHHVNRCVGRRGYACRQCRGQRLAFAGLHFRELSRHQRRCAHQLRIEGLQSQAAACGFTDQGKCRRQVRTRHGFPCQLAHL
jgi:hypothetical protein